MYPVKKQATKQPNIFEKAGFPAKLRLFFCAKLFIVWTVGRPTLQRKIFLCIVGSGRSRQHCIAYFPAKTCLCAHGQHCTSNFFVQCCLRRIQTTLTRQYSYAMLPQHDQYNIVHRLFSS